jgi:hypothetical protein
MISGKYQSFIGLCMMAFMSITQATTIPLTGGLPDLTTFSATVDYAFDDQCYADGTNSGPTFACGTKDKGTDYTVFSAADSSGILTVTGTTMSIDDNGDATFLPVSGGSYSLTANYTGAGLFDATGSTVLATGTTGDASFNSGTIVDADLFNNGFGGTDDAGIIEFEFNNVLGDFAAFGTDGGIIISFNSGANWTGSWDGLDGSGMNFWQHSFNTGNVARVDTFMNTTVIPVPGAVWLFASGLAGLVGAARKKKPVS